MEQLLKNFRSIQEKIESDPAIQPDALAELVGDLDTNVRRVLEEYHYDKKMVHHVDLFKDSPDVRRHIAGEHLEMVKTQPDRLLPYAVDYLCNDLSDRISNDLLMHFGDAGFYGRSFRFRISTLTFGQSFSYSNPVSKKQYIKDRLGELQAQGLCFDEGDHGNLTIPLCNKNVEFLRQYCEGTLRGDVLRFETMHDNISGVLIALDPEQYPVRPRKEAEPKKACFDADRRAVLLSEVKRAADAVKSYQMMANMGQGNLILELLYGSVFDIEESTGLHGQVYHDKMETLEEIRSQNLAARDLEELVKERAFEHTTWNQAKTVCGNLRDKLENAAATVGLFLDEFLIGPNMRHSLTFRPDPLRRRKDKLVNGLDVVINDQIGTSILDSDQNLELILSTLQQVVPELELDRFETTFRMGRRSISMLKLSWIGIFPA